MAVDISSAVEAIVASWASRRWRDRAISAIQALTWHGTRKGANGVSQPRVRKKSELYARRTRFEADGRFCGTLNWASLGPTNGSRMPRLPPDWFLALLALSFGWGAAMCRLLALMSAGAVGGRGLPGRRASASCCETEETAAAFRPKLLASAGPRFERGGEEYDCMGRTRCGFESLKLAS